MRAQSDRKRFINAVSTSSIQEPGLSIGLASGFLKEQAKRLATRNCAARRDASKRLVSGVRRQEYSGLRSRRNSASYPEFVVDGRLRTPDSLLRLEFCVSRDLSPRHAVAFEGRRRCRQPRTAPTVSRPVPSKARLAGSGVGAVYGLPRTSRVGRPV